MVVQSSPRSAICYPPSRGILPASEHTSSFQRLAQVDRQRWMGLDRRVLSGASNPKMLGEGRNCMNVCKYVYMYMYVCIYVCICKYIYTASSIKNVTNPPEEDLNPAKPSLHFPTNSCQSGRTPECASLQFKKAVRESSEARVEP